MDSLRVALIGYGLAGRFFHGPLVRATAGLEVAAIVTRDADRREQAAYDFPGAVLLATAEEVWARSQDFDLVVLATVSGSHARLGGEAIDAGLSLVVEKPLAVTSDEARMLIDRATSRGVLLVPFHNRRWDSDQLTLRKLLDRGVLGDVYRYESRFERWHPRPNPQAWREALPAAEGGGGLRDLGSQVAFVVQHLDSQEDSIRAGKQPDEVGFGVEPPKRWGRLMRGDAGEPVPSEPGRWITFYEGVERALRVGAEPPVRADDALMALQVLDTVRRYATRAGGEVTPG